MSNQISEFLDILDSENTKKLKVKISSKASVNVNPLSFKQQKALVTSGMDGIVGSMSFIKSLNDTILYNSDADDLKIYDRVPIILAFKKQLSKKDIVKDDVTITVDELINQFEKFDLVEEQVVEGVGFNITLKIPTLKEENKHLSVCIEDLKRVDADNIGKNISLIMSYEIPKFIKNITFGDTTIVVDQLSLGERTKIIDNLPADVVTKITDYIVQIREYDEKLLTVNGVLVDVDYSFFE